MLPFLLVLPLLYLRGLQAGPAEHGLISKLLEQVLEEGLQSSLEGFVLPYSLILHCIAMQGQY